MKKRIFSIIVVFMCLYALYTAAEEEIILQQRWKIEMARQTFPGLMERREIEAGEPVALQDISAIYNEEEEQIPLDMLLDLQKYAMEKDWEGALVAYGDESLLMDTETFLEICPDYNKMYAERMGYDDFDSEEIAADYIYKVELDGIEGDEYLVFFKKSSISSMDICYVRDNGNGYQIEYRYGAGGKTGEFVLFRSEAETGNVYYKLQCHRGTADEVTGLYLTRYEGRKVSEDNDKYYLAFESKTIGEVEVKLQPYFTYLNYRNQYAYETKEYIKQNLWMLFLSRENGPYWWGEEEALPYGHALLAEVESVLENKHRENAVVKVDYDNDGEDEIFDRGGKYQDKIIQVDEYGNYVAENLNLGNFDGMYQADRIWFVKVQDKIITLQLVTAGDNELIEAYLVEGNRRIPLVTCQIGYVHEVGSSAYREWWNSVPLLEGTETLVKAEREWFADNCMESIAEYRQNNEIVAYEGEIPFDKSLYELLQKEVYHLIEDEEYEFLNTYSVDTTDDTEYFMSQLTEKDEWVAMMCRWAYLWYTSDGSENYLVYEDSGGTSGMCYLEWYKKTEEGMEYQTTVDFASGRGNEELIWYNGQLIFVAGNISEYRGQLVDWNITVFEDSGEWTNYSIEYEKETENYQCIPIYEETGATVCDWIEENAVDIVEKTENNEARLFEYNGQELTAEDESIFKNLFGMYSKERSIYLKADINHDGAEEYLLQYYYYTGGNDYYDWYIYGTREDEFRRRNIFSLIRSSAQGMYSIKEDFAEFDGETCIITIEQIENSHDYLVRARVIREGEIQQKGVWLLLAELEEYIEY